MGSRSLNLLGNLDLIVLVIALPVFIFADLPLSGYLVGAGLWILARVIQTISERKAKEKLLAGDRKTAMGTIAATSLGRVWLIAFAILVAGLISRDAGFYGAILLVALFTVSLASKGLVHLLTSDQAI